jgi:hypothetical protein
MLTTVETAVTSSDDDGLSEPAASGLAKPKSSSLAAPVPGHANVARLQIAMDDPSLVRGVECFGNLPGQTERRVQRKAAA